MTSKFEISWAKIDRALGIALDPAAAAVYGFFEHGLVQPGALFAAIRGRFGPRVLGQPAPLAMLYLARVANLIVYLLLAAAAVRLAPIHKWTLAMVALMPMSVYLAASLSADAMTLGLSLLVVALTLNLALGSEGPSRRSLLALGLLLRAPGPLETGLPGPGPAVLHDPGQEVLQPADDAG